ncbi:hypothetical protein [Actinomadura macra]|nr:hypothetical protein [Actinomadura macra]
MSWDSVCSHEVLVDALAGSADVATLVGARDRYIWPANTIYTASLS